MFTRRIVLAMAAIAVLSAPAAAQSFPVTLENLYGTTTIPAQPKRVVSVGWHEQDFLYSLGVAPIGVTSWFGDYPYASWPWTDHAREALGAEPSVIPADPTNLEWVLAQDPDLIIAIYVPMDEGLYAELSKIAPVVTTPVGFTEWGVPWQDELRVIDQAVWGSTERSEHIIADIAAKTAKAKAEYPQIVGKTAANVYYDGGNFTTWSSKDLGTRFLIDLGLVFPADLDAKSDPENRITISPENFALLDLDTVVLPIEGGDVSGRKIIENMQLFQNSRLSKEGRALWLDDPAGIAYAAMSWQSPLSLEYLLDVMPPALAAAVDGDPATNVTVGEPE
ncbi:ABC transporter substrate-binding protein [Devosia sp. 2618]|uniref:ABC transporter substrate-binding protein n=1 Tax=Devosia sp. 2618 TaxID=3156454 RepID=UPI003396FBD3